MTSFILHKSFFEHYLFTLLSSTTGNITVHQQVAHSPQKPEPHAHGVVWLLFTLRPSLSCQICAGPERQITFSPNTETRPAFPSARQLLPRVGGKHLHIITRQIRSPSARFARERTRGTADWSCTNGHISSNRAVLYWREQAELHTHTEGSKCFY